MNWLSIDILEGQETGSGLHSEAESYSRSINEGKKNIANGINIVRSTSSEPSI
jgi:hypothetical protein